MGGRAGGGPHPDAGDLATFGDGFGAAHLFIDDYECPDGTLTCENGGLVGTIYIPYCWFADSMCCGPCSPQDGAALCNQTFPDKCGGNCQYQKDYENMTVACW